jgi:Spy/CpxP family protein refolding chaperone
VEHVHNDVRARITTAIKDLNAQISEVMTPEQRQEFRRLLKEKSQRRQANGGAD